MKEKIKELVIRILVKLMLLINSFIIRKELLRSKKLSSVCYQHNSYDVSVTVKYVTLICNHCQWLKYRVQKKIIWDCIPQKSKELMLEAFAIEDLINNSINARVFPRDIIIKNETGEVRLLIEILLENSEDELIINYVLTFVKDKADRCLEKLIESMEEFF